MTILDMVSDGSGVRRRVADVIAPYELDIVVPDAGVAVEFNGCYWHCEAAGKGKTYHAMKRSMCEAAGLQLVQVWEDDWRDRRDVVIRMLAAKLHCERRAAEILGDESLARRLFARKLVPVVVDGSTAARFLDANHIQGKVAATMHLGLADTDGCLRAVLSVRSPRNNARMRRLPGEWEVQRYATYGIVIGGFSRLLACAEREIVSSGEPIAAWVSFSNNDVSDGGMYNTCGFSLVGEIGPDYHYVGGSTGWTRRPKERFQKRRFRESSELLWDESWTEREAAEANGLYRCWDSGKRKWRLDIAVQRENGLLTV